MHRIASTTVDQPWSLKMERRHGRRGQAREADSLKLRQQDAVSFGTGTRAPAPVATCPLPYLPACCFRVN